MFPEKPQTMYIEYKHKTMLCTYILVENLNNQSRHEFAANMNHMIFPNQCGKNIFTLMLYRGNMQDNMLHQQTLDIQNDKDC